MSIRFVLGRAGSGKTYHCLNSIAQESKKEPVGAPLILLVPEQASFEMERELARLCGGGTFRAQVLSFRRLAYRFLPPAGSRLPQLTELGRQLLLRRLIQEKSPSLSVFSQAASQPNFCRQLSAQLREFKHYQITPEMMAAVGLQTNCPPALQGKLNDLAAIYEAYQEYISGHYLDPEDTLNILALAIAQGCMPRETKVWIDGFAGFTPQEYAVLGALFTAVRQVEIALCLDPQRIRQPQEEDLFHPTLDSYWRLRRLAQKAAVQIDAPLILPQPKQKTRFIPAALKHLEKNFALLPVKAYPDKAPEIKLVTAADQRAEVEAVACDILRLVREKGYRFRDIGIILRNFSVYHDLVAAIFLDYDIPFYVDEKRSAAHHPLVEFLRSALEVVNNNFVANSVFRLLKTDLFPLRREEVDLLENYARKHGITGPLWLSSKPWNFRLHLTLADDTQELTEENAELIQQARKRFARLFAPFAEEIIATKSQTANSYCQLLWRLMEKVGVADKLKKWAEEDEKEGHLSRSLEHRQVWQGVVELLEQTSTLLGEQKLTLAEFMQVFFAGLENLQLGLIPASLDRVIVGNVERSRHPHLLAVYVLGLNEGEFPANLQDKSLIADEERIVLEQAGVELAVTRRQRLYHEQYLAYIAFTRSSEYLWLSCPLADDEGKAKRPSALFNHLREMFPQNKVFFYGNATNDQDDDYQSLVRPHKIAAALLQRSARFLQGESLNFFWASVYNEALAHHETKVYLKKLWPALSYQNILKPMRPELTKAFFGTKLHSSVSRLEKFAQCPFAHFAQYGLRLREREEFGVEAPEMGIFYHAALREFVEELLTEGIALRELEESDAVTRINRIVNNLLPLLHREILLSSARLRFLAERIRETLVQAVITLTRQAKKGRFEPLAVEVAFNGEQLQHWHFKHNDDREINLYGQIDRIDVAEAEGKIYLRVIDYKSGNAALKLSDIWYGLSLQLLTYLAVVRENMTVLIGKEGECAGALYFSLYQPYKRVGNPLPEGKTATEQKMDGLILAEERVFTLMGGNEVVHAALKKDGNFTKNSRVVTREEMLQLLQFVKQKIGQLADRILAGEIEIKPYKTADGRTACTYCSYKAVCCFDPAVGNQYRYLPSLSTEQVLRAISAKGGN
ncbi:MAG: helicase-exonuclease AddAB subunit AddB [Firmicutes bacterium]|nr:helicase-exonuclease AddAB subunit AddB [Bacillota bacterium]